jgi:UDP-glucose 4-epimerase
MKLTDNAKLRCLVLGGCGFIGSHIVDGLLEKGYKVLIFDKENVNTKNISHNLNNVELIEGDFANENDMRMAIKDIDYIFHFIGTTLPQSSTQNPIYDIESNVISTIKMLEIAKTDNVKKIIFASSGGTIYGIPQQIPISEDHATNPICPYGISKLMIERYLHLYYHLYGLDYVSLRFSNAYGERQDPNGSQGAIAVFLGNIIKGNPINIWGDGKVVRDYIYVRDIVLSCLKAIEMKENKYHVFNIGSGNGISLNQLIAILKETIRKDIQVRYTVGRKIDVPVNILDVRLARDILGWQPTVSFEGGLRSTLEYFQELGNLSITPVDIARKSSLRG